MMAPHEENPKTEDRYESMDISTTPEPPMEIGMAARALTPPARSVEETKSILRPAAASTNQSARPARRSWITERARVLQTRGRASFLRIEPAAREKVRVRSWATSSKRLALASPIRDAATANNLWGIFGMPLSAGIRKKTVYPTTKTDTIATIETAMTGAPLVKANHADARARA